jgi:hypothetical protein
MEAITPHRWCLLEHPTGELTILSGFMAGYLDADSWRRSSPVQRVLELKDRYIVNTQSSEYTLFKEALGTTGYTWELIKKVKSTSHTAVRFLLSQDEAFGALNTRL